MPSFFVQNFGCRATQADGAALEHELATRGLARAAEARTADLVVPNTCTVTASADEDCQVDEKLVDRPPRYWTPARLEPTMLSIKNSRQPQLDNTSKWAAWQHRQTLTD